jgi:predicted hydrocarbon binding protein
VFDEGPSAWKVHYRSHRQLCQLAEGLIEGAAETFGSRVVVSQPMCVLDGDEHCVLLVRAV